MTEKQKYALNKIICALPDDSRECFNEIALYAVSLGYMPVIKGKNQTYADFIKSKTNRTILKIDVDPKFLPRLAIKFYALLAYDGIFEDAIKERIAYWKKLGYKACCFNCGKCDGTHGYHFDYSNAQSGFICGFTVIPLPSFSSKDIPKIKAALKEQDDFYLKQK